MSPAGTITNDNIDQWNSALTDEADPAFTMSPAGTITNGNIDQWNSALTEEADADPENELQELSMNGDTLFISDGNYIVIPGISGLVEENTEPANVQERLNAGETPFEIYSSDNTLLDSLWGKQYGGGLIFYMDTDTGEGMVCAEEDQSTFQYWYNCIFVITGATDQSIGSGPANTATIIDVQGIGTYAARTCDNLVLNGFEDWYLPSKDELFQMFIVLGMNDLGNFAAEAYHSSSEDDTNNAWVCHFSNGAQYASSKLNFHYVRAVRSF